MWQQEGGALAWLALICCCPSPPHSIPLSPVAKLSTWFCSLLSCFIFSIRRYRVWIGPFPACQPPLPSFAPPARAFRLAHRGLHLTACARTCWAMQIFGPQGRPRVLVSVHRSAESSPHSLLLALETKALPEGYPRSIPEPPEAPAWGEMKRDTAVCGASSLIPACGDLRGFKDEAPIPGKMQIFSSGASQSGRTNGGSGPLSSNRGSAMDIEVTVGKSLALSEPRFLCM